MVGVSTLGFARKTIRLFQSKGHSSKAVIFAAPKWTIARMGRKKKVVAIIPARGGSKGLPRKNVRLLGGLPLIGHAIQALRQAKLVDAVVVSTDDAEIAEISRAQGAEVVIRPAEISGDTASSESALHHALDFLHQDQGREYDVVLFAQCTAPFTTPQEIDGTAQLVVSGEYDSSFAVASTSEFLWQRGAEANAVGVNHDGGPRMRRQDLEPQYVEKGSVYAMSVPIFQSEGTRFCGKTGIYVSDDTPALDIDDARDLAQAEALFHVVHKHSSAARLPVEISCIVFDFDGVFTDRGVHVEDTGSQVVRCDRGDELAIQRLKKLGVPMLVLSDEGHSIAAAKCSELGLECLNSAGDKRSVLEKWLAERGYRREGLIYVGDDVNDLESLRWAGCAAAPLNAHPEVDPSIDLRIMARGGHGAVRALADLVASAMASGSVSLAATDLRTTRAAGAGYSQGDSEQRPWGCWRVEAVGQGYCVKRIDVKPSHGLSLQKHRHRSETWLIVSGSALIRIDNQTFEASVGDTIEVPIGAVHTIKCTSKNALEFIEVQRGEILEESDIIRLEDDYGRTITRAEGIA